MNKIYLGWDTNEQAAYDVAAYSIRKYADNIDIVPLTLDSVKDIFTRPIEQKYNPETGVNQLYCPISQAPMSTEFAISRFSVPFLGDKGWVAFADSDIVLQDDINKLFELADNKYAVMVVKHKHEPTKKYHDAGRLQTFYKRKNWSSVVLWNLDHSANKKFTINDLNTLPGRDLHAFFWLENDEIGELPQEWNFLVGVNEGKLEDQKILHYTDGTPAFEGHVPQETDYIWNKEYKECIQQQ